LQVLYDKDVISEDAIMAWASEKRDADEIDKVFLKQSEPFIQVPQFSYPCLFTEWAQIYQQILTVKTT
jgi:hypothetical protein